MADASYFDVLDGIHRTLHPRTYLEIGIRHGDSTKFALDGTRVVAVDPCPYILQPLPPRTVLRSIPSDDFFAAGTALDHFGGQPVDLTFIDGMHLFEFALRDFLNAERISHAGSVILLHDCLPPRAEVATREINTKCWTGDVWKLLLYLREERPDLDLCVFDASPTGLGVIQRLDPGAAPPDLDAAVERYRGVDFSVFENDVLPNLEIVRGDWENMRRRLPAEPWQERPNVEALVAARDRRRATLATRGRRVKRHVLKSSAGTAALRLRRRLLRRG